MRSVDEVLAGEVKRWRHRRGLTAQQLADRVAEIGGGLDRVAIAKIEVGKRGLTLRDWLELSWALAVPPVALLCPVGEVDEVALLPGVGEQHPDLWAQWLTGIEGPFDADRLAVRPGEFRQAEIPASLFRRHRQALAALQHADSRLKGAQYAGSEPKAQAARQARLDALVQLADVLDRMVEASVRLPALPAPLLADLRDLTTMRHGDQLRALATERTGDGER